MDHRPVVEVPRQVERREDMSPDGSLRLYLQEDGDVVIEVHGQYYGDEATARIEFCSSGGGGHSPRTLEALKLLMAAMQADNDAQARSLIDLRDYEPKFFVQLRPEDRDYSR